MLWKHLLVVAFVLAQTQTPPAGPQQPAAPPQPLPTQKPPTRADVLRGKYGRYRANNDLLFYHLDVRVDPEKKSIAGRNTIRFRMLKDDTRIQLDLYANLNVDRILLGATPLKYEREINTVYVDFPQTLKAGREYAIDFYYSGMPKEQGRFGGMSYKKDPTGQDWIFTACEGEGASIWCRRARLRDADPRRGGGEMADHPAHGRLEADEDPAHEGTVRGGDGPVLRERHPTVKNCRGRPG